MAARLFRAEGSEVRLGKAGSVLETGGRLRGAPTGSRNYFFLSDVGAGVQPLYLIGEWFDIGPYLTSSGKGIRNIRVHMNEAGVAEKMDDIYASAGRYKPGKNKGLFPALDAGTAIASTAVGFAGGAVGATTDGLMVDTTNDVGGGVSDSASIFKQLFGKKKKKPHTNLIYIEFRGYATRGATHLGNGKIRFIDHAGTLLNLIAPLVDASQR